jgi:predicted nucleic acid-binding protein
MERLAIDSSVAVKWFSQEDDTDKAVQIRDAHVRGDFELIATPLLYCEVTNALRFKPDFGAEMLRRAVEALFKLHMVVEEIDESILKRSAEIAFDSDITIYDALPVAVAEKNSTVCVTADERTQYNRLKGKYPVRLLRDFPFE